MPGVWPENWFWLVKSRGFVTWRLPILATGADSTRELVLCMQVTHVGASLCTLGTFVQGPYH